MLGERFPCSQAGGGRTPRHWTEAYIGWPYVEGRFDCADLVVLVMREQFGRTIELPVHAEGTRARDAQIAALKDELATPVADACEGDAALMRATGRKRVLGHHIGVWCDAAGEPHVLHCIKGLGTCLHPVRSLETHGLELTGCYRWRESKASFVVNHKLQ